MPVALQLYTVRQQLAEDFLGTLQRIRDLGYRAVETYPFPAHVSPAMAREVFASLGLEVVAMHCDLPVGAAWPRVRAEAAALNCGNVIWHGWPRPSEYDSIEGVYRLADSYNRAHACAREWGLQFGLHNHWWEFEPVNGAYPYRILRELLNPEVFLEIDAYWVKTAGLDPASVIAELAPRVRFLHLKDGPATHGRPMTALGQGVLDFPTILKVLPQPVSLIVELDECATDIFRAAELSLRYLESIAPGR